MLEKTFSPADAEQRIYEEWENSGAFKCSQPNRAEAETYCIVIPPPNVTGSLHMGHALNNTVQDILIRYKRMCGLDVLWQPGMDHAGIATQMVVERQLDANNEPGRREMGRDAFIKRVWEWKAESGGTIINQLKRLGASCDWSRERFTMDEGLSEAVLKVFVELYNDGLIYKDKRLVNWDPKLLTAISDLEVIQTETKGHLWHFKYPVKGEEGAFITVATTRPETMLGDTAVAVSGDDPRYTDLIGKTCILPLVGREIPIVADEYADPDQGSGAVKITPAHDFNDFEVGKRHNLEVINILDEHACIKSSGFDDFTFGHRSPDLRHPNVIHADQDGIAGRATFEKIPEKYRGLDRYKAREIIIADMEALGLVEKIEDHDHTVPYGDRSHEVIEPWLTDQWYVNAAELAKPAIKAVEEGDTKFVPKNWDKTYFEWMRNIQPWCISRQLWWGHQIPAWYGPDGEVFVAHNEDAAQEIAHAHYGRPVALERDSDVLDTWFSSALWPFSTLGWPHETKELERFYPTNVLVTGFDIIFFWVARMMMFGLHFMKEVPFNTVYIHALVRDEKGAKMSKSKGNVMDPLDLIDEYGADAVRFTLAAMAAQGRDIKLAKARVEGYRNFTTKLWNAARFAEMNECFDNGGFDPVGARETVNRWIAGELERTVVLVTGGIEAHRYNESANALYKFVWNVFCDWYLELIKPLLNGDDEAVRDETRAMTGWVLTRILQLLHPFMPFMTEELWKEMGVRETSLIMASWPEIQGLSDPAADSEMHWLIRFVSAVRSVRSEMNIPAGMKIPLVVTDAKKGSVLRVSKQKIALQNLARLTSLEIAENVPEGSVQIVLDEATLAIPLEGVIDIDAETRRLEKEIAKAQDEISGIDKKLANKNFTSRAPAHVVETQRERRGEAAASLAKLRSALERYQGAAK